MTTALAPPPPLQTPATPILAFLTSSTEVRVVTIRAPELFLVLGVEEYTIQVDDPKRQLHQIR